MGKRKDVGGGGGVAGAAAPHRNKRPRPLVEEVDGCGEAGGGQDHPREGAPGASKEMGENKFARALGSTDYQTRERGLAALTRWLAGRAAVEEMDLLKLWKGVFYCFWHSDKAPIQVSASPTASLFLRSTAFPRATSTLSSSHERILTDTALAPSCLQT